MLPSQELISLDIDTNATYRVLFLPKLPGEKSPPDESLSPSTASPSSDALVTIGDVYEVLVEDIGNKGDGIARIGPGYIILIPKTDIGHKVKIKINSVTSRCAFAEVIEYLV
jgi:predicted RNA-binding protein with TRAM domain